MSKPKCEFESIENQFNFGRYKGLSLADVLDINPSYIDWCVKYCTGVIFKLSDTVIEEIKIAYPNFIMDAFFDSRRIGSLSQEDYDDYDGQNDYDSVDDDSLCNYDSPTYDRYSGSWAQDVEGYSDDDIDTIFDGDPSAYWNID